MTEPFTCAKYRYCLMERDGQFQWRWMDQIPPEARGNPAVSPVFDTKEAAIAWGEKRHRTPTEQWKPVKP